MAKQLFFFNSPINFSDLTYFPIAWECWDIINILSEPVLEMSIFYLKLKFRRPQFFHFLRNNVLCLHFHEKREILDMNANFWKLIRVAVSMVTRLWMQVHLTIFKANLFFWPWSKIIGQEQVYEKQSHSQIYVHPTP